MNKQTNKQRNTSLPCTLPHLSSHSSLVENWFWLPWQPPKRNCLHTPSRLS